MSTPKVLQPLVSRNHFVVTGNVTLTRNQCGDCLVHNTGATGTVTVTLPVMADKLKVRFLRVAAQTITIDPNGTDIIKDASGASLGAGMAKSLTDAGAYLELECDGVAWNVVAERPGPTGGLADGSVTTAKIAAGALSADATGRAIMASSLFTEATVDDKVVAGAINGTKLKDATVTAAKLAAGAGLAALIAAGLGASAAYVKTTNGAQTLLASDAAARVALIVVVVDETFADAGGTQTTFTIGETDTVDKYAAAALFTGATAGSIFVLAGTLTANKALLVTANDAAGAGTGGISVTALVLDAAA